ncbi:ribbon-helix-helix domain-containing protein [Solidesulfovibrio carbinolicus]|uniref:Uncharacterized protein n=1 Tax=Solidesulfovibrio carbinolicus TaxID=296842 RepID=A0A4P6HID0_9BACT|nr:CopG family transcriptional regulator [Solidesulfovibrio carbinolicus]QAZ66807.1 hypothetical protein C3Y92_05940 [Solidesulfovibrio carbinolicus]
MDDIPKPRRGRPRKHFRDNVQKHFLFSTELSKRLAILSERENQSEAEIVRHAVERYLTFAGV